jgi:beta-galactosidase
MVRSGRRLTYRVLSCNHLCFVTVEVLDKENVLCPDSREEIQFSVDGPGRIRAVGNGNPTSIESFQKPRRSSFQGRALVILNSDRQKGTLILKARIENLPTAETAIQVTGVDPSAGKNTRPTP